MARCKRCGKGGLFFKVNSDGLCKYCEAETRNLILISPNIEKQIAVSESPAQKNKKVPEIQIGGFTIHEDIRHLLWFGDGPYKNLSQEDMANGKESYTFFGIKLTALYFSMNEPSLIYTNEAVHQPKDESIVPRPPYFPKYTDLTPEQRWIYLKLLSNPYNTDIDIGYVFILYYGLERHLLQGNFESSYRVIIKLRDVHKNKSFQSYSASALILTAMLKEKGEFVLEFINSLDKDYEFNFSDNLFLICYYSFNIPLLTKDIMRMAKTFEFQNTNYIKKYPDIFNNCLQNILLEKIGTKNVDIKKYISDSELRKIRSENTAIFANGSIMENTVPVPQIADNFKLKKEINIFLELAHEAAKVEIAKMRKENKKSDIEIGKTKDVSNVKPITAIIPQQHTFSSIPSKKLKITAAEAVKKYWYYEEEIKKLYARREETGLLDMAIKACEEEIEIAKYAIPELTKPIIQKEINNHDEFINNLRDYAQGKVTPETKKIEIWAENYEKNGNDDDDDDDVEFPGLYSGETKEIPMNLGGHTGYKQLCIIREKQGNFQEVIRLAEQAKAEGWYGDWDKRIEKARKKLESK